MRLEWMESKSLHEDERGSSLTELRTLLLKKEQIELRDTQRRLRILESQSGELHVERLSELLPEAVAHRGKQDNKLATALAPAVEDTIRMSVKRNPQPLVDAIFPIIGPAIRKSIQEAISTATETMNGKMNSAFSFQSLRWRAEARRSGLTYAEVVLRDTLLYRVEQIFLIDVRTGLPLQHVALDSAASQDGSIVSGMLTAIQDFVRDSFGAAEGESVGTLEVGELTVWIESGPRASLAAVIRGMPPRSLRRELREIVEAVHLYFVDELADFDGDAKPFDRSKPLLMAALTEEFEEKATHSSFALKFLGGLLLLGLMVVAFMWYQRNTEWRAFVERLDAEPGIVVTGVSSKGGKKIVRGLLDPMAVSPTSLLDASRVRDSRVGFEWEGYTTLDPEIVVRRARALLTPPPTVKLEVRDGTVYASGSASRDWIESARTAAAVAGAIGVYDDSAVVDQDQVALLDRIDTVNNHLVRFLVGTTNYAPGDDERLDDIAGSVKVLFNLADKSAPGLGLLLRGHASAEGSPSFNMRISERRANQIYRELTNRGVDGTRLTFLGTGEAWRTGLADEFNRSVSFEVVRP